MCWYTTEHPLFCTKIFWVMFFCYYMMNKESDACIWCHAAQISLCDVNIRLCTYSKCLPVSCNIILTLCLMLLYEWWGLVCVFVAKILLKVCSPVSLKWVRTASSWIFSLLGILPISMLIFSIYCLLYSVFPIQCRYHK